MGKLLVFLGLRGNRTEAEAATAATRAAPSRHEAIKKCCLRFRRLLVHSLPRGQKGERREKERSKLAGEISSRLKRLHKPLKMWHSRFNKAGCLWAEGAGAWQRRAGQNKQRNLAEKQQTGQISKGLANDNLRILWFCYLHKFTVKRGRE